MPRGLSLLSVLFYGRLLHRLIIVLVYGRWLYHRVMQLKMSPRLHWSSQIAALKICAENTSFVFEAPTLFFFFFSYLHISFVRRCSQTNLQDDDGSWSQERGGEWRWLNMSRVWNLGVYFLFFFFWRSSDLAKYEFTRMKLLFGIYFVASKICWFSIGRKITSKTTLKLELYFNPP